MRKKIVKGFVMLLLAGVMLAGCKKKVEESTNPESASPESAPLSYVEEHDLEFFQGTSFTTKGVRYNEENPEDCEVIDVDVEITEITVVDAKQEGYQTITIQMARRGQTWADFSSGDPHSNNRLAFISPAFFMCDMYTGRILRFGELSMEEGVEGTPHKTDLEWGGSSYSISYMRNTRTEFEEWSGDFHPFGVYGTYVVTVPKDYDGIVLMMTPKLNAEDDVYVAEEYILDEWKEGSYLLRVSDLMEMLGN